MRFWDTSAVVPLLVNEPQTSAMRSLLSSDSAQVVWWETRTECVSALAKKTRQRILAYTGEAQARVLLVRLSNAWSEVLPFPQQRALAEFLIDHHPLSSADAMQLAAAMLCQADPLSGIGNEFVCLDNQLRNAAADTGFSVLP